MAQFAIHEAKKALRRELKKRIAGMSDDVKSKESASIVNKVSKAILQLWMEARLRLTLFWCKPSCFIMVIKLF